MSGLALLLVLAAPMADLWPWAAQRQADGRVVYSYDLTALKASGGTADAKATHGAEAVAAFLHGLPRTVKAEVAPGTPLEVSAGRGAERAPLAPGFAAVGDGPWAADDPLGRRREARLRAPLDPDEPRLLLPVDAVVTAVEALQDGALAAVALDAEPFHRELWTRLAAQALQRFRAGQGDAREGALALLARVAVAQACLDPAKLAAAVAADPELRTAAEAELARFADVTATLVAPRPWAWTPALTCAWRRAQALAWPFETSRAGAVAALTFLDLLQRDPKLASHWALARSRRDRFEGAVAAEPALRWLDAAQGQPAAAIEGLAAFLEALPAGDRAPPPLLAAPQTPFTRFLAALEPAERLRALDELAAAAEDGRLAPAATMGWPEAREAARAALVRPPPDAGLLLSGEWRERLRGTFAAAQGGHHEAGGGGEGPARETGARTELLVRLRVPPVLEVEPAPAVFTHLAAALQALEAALRAEGLQGVQLVDADGRRGGAVVPALRTWAKRLGGLAALAAPADAHSRAAGEARRWALAWRGDPAFAPDVRQATAAPVFRATERAHAAVLGVARRELAVAFAQVPTLSCDGEPTAFQLVAAEQRYLVPTLVTAGGVAPATRAPVPRGALRQAVDAVQRDTARAEGAFLELLQR